MDVEVRLDDFTGAYLANLSTIDSLVGKAAFDIEAGAKVAIMTGPKTGCVYKRRRRGKAGLRKGSKAFITHQASARGEAPANDQGVLAGSIHVVNTGEAEREVRVGAEYGAQLEEGLDRPFLGPAAEKVKPGFEANIAMVLEGRRGR